MNEQRTPRWICDQTTTNNGNLTTFQLVQCIDVDDPQCHHVVHVKLLKSVDQPQTGMYAIEFKTHVFQRTLPSGLEYDRRMQETGPRWNHADKWRSHMSVITARLKTKIFHVDCSQSSSRTCDAGNCPFPTGRSLPGLPGLASRPPPTSSLRV